MLFKHRHIFARAYSRQRSGNVVHINVACAYVGELNLVDSDFSASFPPPASAYTTAMVIALKLVPNGPAAGVR